MFLWRALKAKDIVSAVTELNKTAAQETERKKPPSQPASKPAPPVRPA